MKGENRIEKCSKLEVGEVVERGQYPGFISLVETGRSNVSDDTIKSICSAFSINESSFSLPSS